MTTHDTVTVAGAGTMGPGIAQTFAARDYRVTLADISDDALTTARQTIEANLAQETRLGLISEDNAARILGRIGFTSDIPKAIAACDIIVEAISEKPAVKTGFFETVAAHAPVDAVVWSNTSSLDVFALCPVALRGRLMIVHWFAPPQILPLVEVVRGEMTPEALIDDTVARLRQMGKAPVVLQKFIPGFIINRLLRALGREAFHLIDNGYTTAQDLDVAARASLAMRMMVLGIVQRYDFTGLDLSVANLKNPDFFDAPVDLSPRTLSDLADQGKTGVRAGQGFYDYSHTTPAEAAAARDDLLWKIMAQFGDLATAERNV
ncbi:hypothetical protein A3731_03170 [Roseovarius sp. HI0049]|nr:hypothetical protein A3731_03170 [Roseovarius sp. HI0049]